MKLDRYFLFKKSVFMPCLALAVCACALLSTPAFAAAKAKAAPTTQEQAELRKFESYSGNIEVIAPNGDNGLLAFLEKNAGKTVFFDSALIRYLPLAEGMTAKKMQDEGLYTDRFDNAAFTQCWSADDIAYQGVLESGERGFPLPLDTKDIEKGCAARIRIEMTFGDGSVNMDQVSSMDQTEIFFAGFFDVTKESLADGKTFYRLKETRPEVQTVQAYYKHATKKDRGLRKIWPDEEPDPAKGLKK